MTAWSEYVRRAVLGGVLLVPLYGITFYNQYHQIDPATGGPGRKIELLAFTSPGVHGVSVWTLLGPAAGLSAQQAQRLSSIAALAASLLPIFLFKRLGVRFGERQVTALLAAMLLTVLLLFSHCDPEYYVIPLPFLFAVLGARPLFTLVGVGFAFTYAANVAYAIRYAAERGVTQSGKTVFLGLLGNPSPSSVSMAQTTFLILVALTNLAVIALLYRNILRPRSSDAAGDGPVEGADGADRVDRADHRSAGWPGRAATDLPVGRPGDGMRA